MGNLTGIGVSQQSRDFSSKITIPATPRPPGLKFGGLGLHGISQQIKTFDPKTITLEAIRNFTTKTRAFNFVTKKRTFNFTTIEKVFDFVSKKK
jgi:hypothetical protein